MKFVLFRHAQKGFVPFDDPELSPKGFAESAKIPDLIRRSVLPVPTRLLVSPKRRTAQTFYPTAKDFDLDLVVERNLDQRNAEEGPNQFRERIRLFIEQVSDEKAADGCFFACTHYDVIEESMSLIPCDRDLNTFELSHWAPVQYVVFEIKSGLWKYIKKGDAR